MPRRHAAGRQPRGCPLHLGRRRLLVAAQRLLVAAVHAEADLLRPQRADHVQPPAAASAAAGSITAIAADAATGESSAFASGHLAQPAASARLCQVRRIIAGIVSGRALCWDVIVYDKLAAVLLRSRLRAVWRLLRRPVAVLHHARGGARARRKPPRRSMRLAGARPQLPKRGLQRYEDMQPGSSSGSACAERLLLRRALRPHGRLLR